MNWQALWKESGIDPESEKAELLSILIGATLELINYTYCEIEGKTVRGHYGVDIMEHTLKLNLEYIKTIEKHTGLSFDRVKEILRSE